MELINPIVLTVFYFLALVFMFIGIALVSDIFMEAIEMITSQT
jgi:solute carrier family 8 (sodium/calcium exchanger)